LKKNYRNKIARLSNQTTKMAEWGGVELSNPESGRGITHLLFI